MKLDDTLSFKLIDQNNLKILTEFSDDTHNTLTPIELCVDIVSKVHNDNKFKFDTKVLILCNIEFIKAIRMLYNELNINMDNVYFVTVCSTKAELIELTGVNVIKYDVYKEFFEDKDLPKFDVVIGNPPYQDGNLARAGNKTAATLWPYFIKKSLNVINDKGFISLITPHSWMGPGKQLIRGTRVVKYFTENQLHYVNFNCDKYFDVGSSFCNFLLQKTNNYKKTEFQYHNSTYLVDIKDLKFIPHTISIHGMNIIKKILLSNIEPINLKCTQHCRSDKPNISKTKNTQFKFPVKHTNSNNIYSDIEPMNLNVLKVLINLTGSFNPTYDAGKLGTSQIVRWIEVNNESEGQNLINYINSTLIKYVLKCCRYSGSASSDVILSIPELDFTKSWTNLELYQHFNLTTEEIEYIEENV